MKSYVPAAAFGLAPTAAAFGFGAATSHASAGHVNQSAGQVAGPVRTAGYSVQIGGGTDVDLSHCAVTDVTGLTQLVGEASCR
ncbi:MAG: hypothetical protein KIH64_013230 [Mycobacterium sp.]|nr:hypothetical protein [Mycobacterium sp.]